MSKEVFTLEAVLKLNDQAFQQGIDSAKEKSSGFKDHLIANLASGAITKAFDTIVDGFQKIASVITNHVAPAVSRLDTMNSYGKTMNALGFSTEEAAEAQSKLSSAIDGLPTTLDGIISWQQQFTALSDDIEGATDLTIALNNATLAAGKGQEAANNAMANWYGIIAAGAPDAQHWQSIYSTMPAQMNLLAQSILGTEAKSDDLFNAWKEGEVTTEQVTAALIALNSEGLDGVASFADQAQIGAQTIETAYGNIDTAISRNVANVINVLNGDASEGGGRIVEMLLSIKNLINQVGSTITEFVNAHEPEITAVMTAINNILNGGDLAANIETILSNVGSVVSELLGNLSRFLEQNWSSIADTLARIFSSLVQTLVELLPVLIPIALAAITAICSTLLDNLPMIIESAVQIILTLVAGLVDSLPTLIPAIVDAVILICNTLLDNLGFIIDAALKIIVALAQGLVTALPKLHKAVPEIIGKIIGVLIMHLPEIIMAAVQIVIALAQGLIDSLPYIIEGIGILIEAIMAEIEKGPTEMGAVALAAGEELINQFLEGVNQVWSSVTEAFTNFFGGIATFFEDTGTLVTEKLSEAWQAIVDFFEPLIEFVSPVLEALQYLFETIWQAIQILVERALTAISDKFTEIWNGIVSFITPILDSISTFIGNALDWISNKFTEIWNGIVNFLNPIIEGIRSFIEEKFNQMKELIRKPLEDAKAAVSKVFTDIQHTINDVVEKAKTWGKDLLANFIAGIKSKMDDLASALRSVADKIRDIVGFSEPKEGPLSNFHTYAPDMIDLFTSGLYENEDKLRDAFSDVFAFDPEVVDTPASGGVSGAVNTYAAQNTPIELKATIPVYFGSKKIGQQIVTVDAYNDYVAGGR